MAKIEFKGYPEKHEGNGPWEITEPHRKQKDGQWVTEARTYHKVWLPESVTEIPADTLVTVIGTQKTRAYEKDGTTKYSLIVYADSITWDSAASSATSGVTEPWDAVSPNYSDEAPF